MHIFIYTYIHIYIHIYMHTYIHTYIYKTPPALGLGRARPTGRADVAGGLGVWLVCCVYESAAARLCQMLYQQPFILQ